MPLEEVTVALEKKRHELVLSGPNASKTIENEGMDDRIYDCNSLNFIDITNTCLSEIKPDIGKLSNLSNLVLRGNQLVSLPSEIGSLSKLKLIDISRNKIASLPDELSNLKHLQSFNASANQLDSVPDFSTIENLSIVDLSHNQLTEFPQSLANKQLIHLSELLINDNLIESVPSECGGLPSLKILDICNNKLANVPGELSDCLKLKEIRLKGNKLKDRRLLKLVDQCHYKQVVEYIRSHCPKSANSNATEQQASTKTKSKGKKKKAAVAEVDSNKILCTAQVIHVKDESPAVKVSDSVKDVRPFIVACIVRNVNLQEQNKFKKFITLQTKLHDTVCTNRTTATIATHDLSKINGNLLYDAKDPNDIMIQPLLKSKPLSTSALYQQLRDEAEALRKEKKRNTFSGIHKYLYLLDHKLVYPFLSDSSGSVISFPPITNSDLTKITSTTTDLFIEVTSSTNFSTCKQVMDTLILEMVKSDIAVTVGEDNSKTIVLEQVRIEDKESNFKSVYPSRTDLNFDEIKVVHE